MAILLENHWLFVGFQRKSRSISKEAHLVWREVNGDLKASKAVVKTIEAEVFDRPSLERGKVVSMSCG